MSCWTVETSSPEQTRAVGALLGRFLEPAAVVLLSGDLGAGKTCFTQGLGQGLAVASDEPVVSPSYTLMNHYRGRLDLYHFDFYRLNQAEDLQDLGFNEYLCGNGVTVVEWGDRFPELALHGLWVHLEAGPNERRNLHFRADGEAERALLDHLRRHWGGQGEDHA